MPRLHQDTCCPETCIPDEQLLSGYMLTDTCRRIQVARPGYLWTVSRRHNYYSFMSRSTCIPLYPATDGRQTGDNFVADTRYMSTATSGYKWIQTSVNASLEPVILAYMQSTQNHTSRSSGASCSSKTATSC